MVIVCKMDDEDDYEITNSKIININDNNCFSYTFWNEVKPLKRFYSDEGLDLLYISLFVFAVDRSIPRDLSEDSWSRNLEIHIPVLAYEKWEREVELLESMLGFLSGDSWRIIFRKRKKIKREEKMYEKFNKLKGNKYSYNTLCMFSGGLDSGIGAINLLENSEDKTGILFISHYGGGKGTKEYQDILRKSLMKEYKIGEEHFYQNYAKAVNGQEDTTRTRSFMFFSHAIAYATAMEGQVELIIPENGLISLNIPLTHTRLGTSSTRTTHPYYIKMFQQLIIDLGIQLSITNPYQFKTKGEMIFECKNRQLLQDNIANTMSCSHPDVGRFHGADHSYHCGYCFPCTIRRAAIKRGQLNDTSEYWDDKYSNGNTARQNLNVYKLAIKNFNKELSFLRIQCSGPIEEKINDFTDLYNRGMEELKDFLEDINV